MPRAEDRTAATILWQPQFLKFKEALEAAESFTEADVRNAMLWVPRAERELLSLGPLPRRWDCRVCVVFDDLIRRLDRDQAAADLSDPRWVVYLYHEVPKIRMEHRDQLHHGALANECYERGVAVYRAAGWAGDAEEANA